MSSQRLQQGLQVGFVYLFLYGLLFGYVTWTMYYSCGPSIFSAVFSGLVILYTFYSVIQFWGENNNFMILWIVLLILSLSSFILSIISSINICTEDVTDKNTDTDNDTTTNKYQWVYQIYFPDIALLPWIFILGFTSMRYFFTKWKLTKLFFVFLSYNAFFIGIGIYIIGFYILNQRAQTNNNIDDDDEYKLIYQFAIVIIIIGAIPCCIYLIYIFIYSLYNCYNEEQQNDNDNDIDMDNDTRSNDYSEELDPEEFNPYQEFTPWIAIQIITSFLDLWSDIAYVLLSDFYSSYLKIACWIFIFFQLIPDIFILLQLISDPNKYEYGDDDDDDDEIIWFPIRKRWKNNSHLLERTIIVSLYILLSSTMFLIFTTILILMKIIPIIKIQNLLFHRNCCKIIQIPQNNRYSNELRYYNNDDEDDDDDDDKDEDDMIIVDLRMHLIFLLFEVFFESIPLVLIIIINSHILLNNMTPVAWISLSISGYVVLRNIYMFIDDICFNKKSQRKLYYCL